MTYLNEKKKDRVLAALNLIIEAIKEEYTDATGYTRHMVQRELLAYESLYHEIHDSMPVSYLEEE